MSNHDRDIDALAGLFGVETSYVNTFGDTVTADDATLLAILRARGAFGPDGHGPDAMRAAITRRREQLASRLVPPIIVAIDGATSLPLAFHGAWTLRLETGETSSGSSSGDGIALEAPLPAGYHRLSVRAAETEQTALILAAPPRAWRNPDRPGRWSVFAPLYALRRRGDRGIGDFTTCLELIRAVAAQGGSAVAMLPLMATYGDELFDPSPYAPVSRLFWNEIFLDLENLSAVDSSDGGARVSRVQHDPAPPHGGELVDYRNVMREKRSAIENFILRLDREPELRAAFEAHVEARPLLSRYAAFRAVTESRACSWRQWSDVERGGALPPEIVDSHRQLYHEVAQWLAEGELTGVSSAARSMHCGLFLDFPLGSNADGFDIWNEPELYVDSCSIGAPPDLSYPQGQDWGFRPLDPDAIRASGYAHWIDCIRTQLRHASYLRLDHVMSLYRLYWIPAGFPPSRGAYVRYDAAEFFAILAIESHRAATQIIGEDLGTVPDEIITLMQTHGVDGMYVIQRQLAHHPAELPPPPRPSQVVSVNNHDMAPFASFHMALDLEQRHALGVITDDRIDALRAGRTQSLETLERWAGTTDRARALEVLLQWMRRSDASMTIITLEDLWGETFAQNIPTTSTERPNWRHRLAFTVEEIVSRGELRTIAASR